MNNNNIEYDALVIGSGIAGQEASLNLASNGFKVLLVEKDLSLGGKMIHLSKVFPTLDCGACIATPKISETARNPNITVMTYSEVQDIEKIDNTLSLDNIKSSTGYNLKEIDPQSLFYRPKRILSKIIKYGKSYSDLSRITDVMDEYDFDSAIENGRCKSFDYFYQKIKIYSN